MKNKANDDIPEDEMLLAEAIAAATARGLKHTTGHSFGFDYGGGPLVRCCALGALSLAGRVSKAEATRCSPADRRLASVIDGNDRSDDWTIEDDDLGESLGWAFRLAMTQEDSP